MAVREQDVKQQDKQQTAVDEAIPEDWFWRPLKRYETTFVQSGRERSAWRESGRRLQIATRVTSQLDSQQARLAYLYDREGDRGSSYRDAVKQNRGRTTW
ncbi:hypothetical protein [Effusibacillus pohliae]|uniref:hypothetical protein n=1 Tax=Effusibacillus pohliae TaxID=232270 RepID=UPI0003701A39|nr:hypothetical protein [Effusibacillus pohliae]